MIDVGQIYTELYARFNTNQINVFLCGAAYGDTSLRSMIAKKLGTKAKVNIVFPEWLFSNLMVSKDNDLLTLEHDLAKNVDLIVLPLEGLGAICELGAFASCEELTKRILVLNNKQYAYKTSFINDGPIRLIKKQARNNIIYYHIDKKESAVDTICNRVLFYKKDKIKKSINNLFNLSRLIGFIVAIHQPANRVKIEEALLDWDESIPEKYIDPAIEILIEKGHILTAGSGNSETLSLTNDGYDYYIIIAPKQARKIKKTASMRAVGLWNKYKYQNRIDMEKERARLLS